MTNENNTNAAQNSQKVGILNNLKKVISQVYEISLDEVNIHATFLEMGLDSISIIQVKQLVKNEYSFDVPVNRLFDDICTLEKLSNFIAATLPPIVTHEAAKDTLQRKGPQQVVPDQSELQATNPENLSTLENIIHYQLQIMTKQIEALAQMQRTD